MYIVGEKPDSIDFFFQNIFQLDFAQVCTASPGFLFVKSQSVTLVWESFL